MMRPSPRNSAVQSLGRFGRSRLTTSDEPERISVLRVTVSPIPTTMLGKAVLMVRLPGEPVCAKAREFIPKIIPVKRNANIDNLRCFILFSPLELIKCWNIIRRFIFQQLLILRSDKNIVNFDLVHD